jgi:hypothetical protein
MGKHVSNTARTPAEARTYGDAIADMFCAYLEPGLNFHIKLDETSNFEESRMQTVLETPALFAG